MDKLKFFIFLILSLISCSHQKHYFQSKKVFGVPWRLESPRSDTFNRISQKAENLEEVFKYAMDPDCRWIKPIAGKCLNPQEDQTKKLEELAQILKVETLNFYDIRHSGKRDFDGLSQGYFLESIKEDEHDPWLIDFAGDIYFNGGFTPQKTFSIADPLNEKVSFAKVAFTHGGFMIASSSRLLGANMYNPVSANKKWQEDFQKIVLFGDTHFNGARLDAWATALIVGGERLLNHLWKLERYKGMWGYLYFNKNGEAICSENLKCDFEKSERLVEVPF